MPAFSNKRAERGQTYPGEDDDRSLERIDRADEHRDETGNAKNARPAIRMAHCVSFTATDVRSPRTLPAALVGARGRLPPAGGPAGGYLSTCHTVSMIVPSTHFTTATGVFLSTRGFSGAPPRSFSTSSLSSPIGRIGRSDFLTAARRSFRFGLIAIPRSVMTASRRSPGPGDRRHLVDDGPGCVAEGRQRQDRALGVETVLPAADPVKEQAVRMGHHVGVEMDVHLGRAENRGVHHVREVPLAVVVVRGKRELAT